MVTGRERKKDDGGNVRWECETGRLNSQFARANPESNYRISTRGRVCTERTKETRVIRVRVRSARNIIVPVEFDRAIE